MPMNLSANSVCIGEMLRAAVEYRVPPYQRDYSWTSDELSEMWEDLSQIIFHDVQSFFLGSMVLSNPTPGIIELIDGQQRLTTISILLCALRDILKERDLDVEANQINVMLGSYDWATGETISKLKLNVTNKIFFQERFINNADIDFLRTANNDRRESVSNRLLAQAYIFFYDVISHLQVPGVTLRDITGSLMQALDGQMNIIRINVENEFDAYQLFETLNDRGLDLSVADLIKNYVFRKASTVPERLEEVQTNWNHMLGNLGQHDAKRFLRHYWLSTESVIRDKDLYRALCEKHDTLQKVRTLSKSLKDSAEFYGSLNDIDNDLWSAFDAQPRRRIRRNIEQLNLFRATQHYPLLIVALDVSTPIFPELLEMVVNFTFRYTVIGRESANRLEAAFSKAATYLRNNADAGIADVFEHLREIFPNDDSFVSDFSAFKVRGGPLARYILRSINDHLAGDTGFRTEDDPDKVNLEHILPKSIPEDWRAFFPEEQNPPDEYVDRLGNLTLLRTRLNANARNKPFADKKAFELQAEPYEITKNVLEQDAWGPEQINNRQIQLASVAKDIWRVDY